MDSLPFLWDSVISILRTPTWMAWRRIPRYGEQNSLSCRELLSPRALLGLTFQPQCPIFGQPEPIPSHCLSEESWCLQEPAREELPGTSCCSSGGFWSPKSSLQPLLCAEEQELPSCCPWHGGFAAQSPRGSCRILAVEPRDPRVPFGPLCLWAPFCFCFGLFGCVPVLQGVSMASTILELPGLLPVCIQQDTACTSLLPMSFMVSLLLWFGSI